MIGFGVGAGGWWNAEEVCDFEDVSRPRMANK